MEPGVGDLVFDDPFIAFCLVAAGAIAAWMVHEVAAPYVRRRRVRRFLRREGLAPAAMPAVGARGPAPDRHRPAAPPLRRLRPRDVRLDGADGAPMTSSLDDDVRSALRDVSRRRN